MACSEQGGAPAFEQVHRLHFVVVRVGDVQGRELAAPGDAQRVLKSGFTADAIGIPEAEKILTT